MEGKNVVFLQKYKESEIIHSHNVYERKGELPRDEEV